MGVVKIGIFTLSDTGHCSPAISLAYELRNRGFEVVFFQLRDGVGKVEKHGFECIPYGESQFPLGTWDKLLAELGTLKGTPALVHSGKMVRDRSAASLIDLPRKIDEEKLDLLIVDQVCPEGGSIADSLGIKYITASFALMFNYENGLPPYFTAFPPAQNLWHRMIYGLFNFQYNNFRSRELAGVNAFRKAKGLLPESHQTFGMSNIAQICQMHEELDFPRKNKSLIRYCGYLGGLSTAEDIPFPFDQLSNKPLIYVSFGSLQVQVESRYKLIMEAVANMDVQVVISGGGGRVSFDSAQLPRNVMFVKYAPQLALLNRAALFISHGGMNGTMESLSCGVPILVMPVTNDQPGVAARITHAKVGEHFKGANKVRLRNLIKKILFSSEYRKNALSHKAAIYNAGGGKRAADVVAEALAD